MSNRTRNKEVKIFFNEDEFNKLNEDLFESANNANKFANILEIPTANISRWEQGVSTPPEYVVKLIEKVLRFEGYLE